ncbi:hypothetical protein CRUP_033771, partial [Coryphaenoides rupestris]
TETPEFPEEEEEVDPRIQGELEKLNQSTDDINRWESELEDYRQRFRAVLVEATVKLDEQTKKIGRAVDESKPYWEARRVARQPYFELKSKSITYSLMQLKRRVDERQTKLAAAKAQYRTALNNLETISEEIHAHRRSITTATREQGVGSEGDGDGNEDIANFKMESDGLSSE